MNTRNKKGSAKRRSRGILSGIAHIRCSFNNTLVTITDLNGNTLNWSNGGKVGFKGSRKATPFAGGKSSTSAATEAIAIGLKSVDAKISGFGPGRDLAIRNLYSSGLKINSITDVTPLPHNGVRPSKKRRI